MSAPRVYAAIIAVSAELARTGLPKLQVNAEEEYAYRGIDDLCNRLAPLLAKHRLCILPRVLERGSVERGPANRDRLISVNLKVAFDLVSARDGSTHTIEAYGEALDAGDKGTAKAMTAAYKQAMFQTFCIPVQGADDADACTPRLKAARDEQDPDQGWDQWSVDIREMIGVCETGEAIDRVQMTYRGQLRAASKRRPELFDGIGAAVRTRREVLSGADSLTSSQPPSETRRVAHA